MSDQNNQNNNKNGGGDDRNRRNFNGLVILLGWALVLTVGLNYLHLYVNNNEAAKQTVNIYYDEFRDLVEEGVVEEVIFASDGRLLITTKEGYIYTHTDKDGNTKEYDKNFTLFTMQLGTADPDLARFLDEHGVHHNKEYEPEMPMVMYLMINFVVPVVLDRKSVV